MKTKQKAIICDMDGTLALFGRKNPYVRDFINDKCNEPIKDILCAFPQYKILIVSGRYGKYRDESIEWLKKNSIPFDEVWIPRGDKDRRADTFIKREIYEGNIKDKYDVAFVLDDRNQVVDFWRQEAGLICLQVNYGNF